MLNCILDFAESNSALRSANANNNLLGVGVKNFEVRHRSWSLMKEFLLRSPTSKVKSH